MFILILVTGGAGLLARSVPPMPWLLVAYGRYAATWVVALAVPAVALAAGQVVEAACCCCPLCCG